MGLRTFLAPIGAALGAVITIGGGILNAQQLVALGLSGSWWLVMGLVVFFVSTGALLWQHIYRPNRALPKEGQHTNHAESYFANQRVVLNDILIPETPPIIADKVFENCDIVGPAIITFIGTGLMLACSFDGSPLSTFYEVEEGRGLVGIIGMKDCTIRNSRLHRIGLVGTKAQIAQWQKGFSPPGAASNPN